MQRSGGRVGRPFGHLTIEQLEATVRSGAGEGTELLSVLGELGYRKTPRALELKSLVQRLLRALESDRPDRKHTIPGRAAAVRDASFIAHPAPRA